MPARAAKKSAPKTAPKPSEAKAAAKPSKAGKPRMSLAEAMRALEKAGSAQFRKTYLRHGAEEPLFGVSFAIMKDFVKKIGVDHELARQLWDTGNHDARTLAMKIADPAAATPADLDRWVAATRTKTCANYVAMLAAEGPHADAKARAWLGASDPWLRAAGWAVLAQVSTRVEEGSDEPYLKRVAQIEKSIHKAPNGERDAMNEALIIFGGRSPALRKSATAAAKRIGKVEIDQGDTDCKTRDAFSYIEKMWEHAAAKKFPSPAAQERAREPLRTRC
jgi:3-methyladenine DNA glycosylase AlkD